MLYESHPRVEFLNIFSAAVLGSRFHTAENSHCVETPFCNAVCFNKRFFVHRGEIEMECSAQVQQADEQQGHNTPETRHLDNNTFANSQNKKAVFNLICFIANLALGHIRDRQRAVPTPAYPMFTTESINRFQITYTPSTTLLKKNYSAFHRATCLGSSQDVHSFPLQM